MQERARGGGSSQERRCEAVHASGRHGGQLAAATHNLPMATLGPIRQSLPILAVSSMMALPCSRGGEEQSAVRHAQQVALLSKLRACQPTHSNSLTHPSPAPARAWMWSPTASASGCLRRSDSRWRPRPAVGGCGAVQRTWASEGSDGTRGLPPPTSSSSPRQLSLSLSLLPAPVR